MNNSQFKIYVSVELIVDEDGRTMPTAIIWGDGHRYSIDKVKDVRYAASQKAGGIGTRYTCLIMGQQRYLYFEDPKWFVEKNI